MDKEATAGECCRAGVLLLLDIVLRVRRWDDIKGTMEPEGVPAALSAEHMPGLGFCAVYGTAEEAREDYGDDVPLQAMVRVACDDQSEAVE